MKTLILSQGKSAIVDNEDYDSVCTWKWTYMKVGSLEYAYRAVKVNGKQKNLLLHRQIMGFPKDTKVDHIDGDGLNNKRSNIRLAPKGRNNQNAIS